MTTKKMLNGLGFMKLPDYGLTPYPDRPMIDAVKSFQRRNRLRVDGVMKPDGPTLKTLNRTLAERRPAKSRTLGRFSALARPEAGVPIRASLPAAAGTPGKDTPATWPKPAGLELPVGTGRLGKSPRSEEGQMAFVPVAVPFAVWLMPILGAATATAAIAIYQTLSKSRQKGLRNAYDSDHSNDNFCYHRWQQEDGRCGLRAPKWISGCKSRAEYRHRLCIRNGGTPAPDEPPEWSEKDEEVTPPR